MNKIETCIFDLDGVICDTAKYHFRAWRRLANELGFDFTEEENEQLKGVSRIESLKLILHWGGMTENDEEVLAAYAEKKNNWYLEYIDRMTPDERLVGVTAFLDELKAKGIKIVLGSASKNSKVILERIQLTHYFDAIIDGNSTSKSKPDPEVFLLGAAEVGSRPKNCIVFEDAEKGIEAALKGGFYAVGVGQPDVLDEAHIVIPSFEYLEFEDVLDALSSSVGSMA
ncbi:MAG: beta-phosphoglucomutase [Saprospiraceae bacterium]|nr:beta-phosphoglucomutase [Saprospiraceae bacterium]